MTFEAIECVPLTLPTCEWLHNALQLTRHDCEHTCQQDTIVRQKEFHLRWTFDRTDDVGTEMISMATLRRSQKGCIVFHLEEPCVCFSADRDLLFGASVRNEVSR